MSINWVQNLPPTESGTSPATTSAFTPNANNTLVAFGVLYPATTPTFSGNGSGTWQIVTPPGNYNDTAGDTEAIGYNISCGGGPQTISLAGTGATFVSIIGFEYANVSTLIKGNATVATNGSAANTVITGQSVTVNVGDILLAYCQDIAASGYTLNTSPSGTNRGFGLTGGLVYCVTEYAGTGGTITPSFKSNTAGGSTSYIITQVVMTAKTAGTIFPNLFKIYANGAFQANSFVQSALPTGIVMRLYGSNNTVHVANLVQSGTSGIKLHANGQLICNSTILV